MDNVEAGAILDDLLSRLRSLPYAELVQRYLDETESFEQDGASGVTYQLEVQAFWDSPRAPGRDLRVMASIDDGSFWRSISPLSRSFIMAPDGQFVGE